MGPMSGSPFGSNEKGADVSMSRRTRIDPRHQVMLFFQTVPIEEAQIVLGMLEALVRWRAEAQEVTIRPRVVKARAEKPPVKESA